MTILELNEELQVQREESQQQFEDLKEKFLIQATAYSLARKMKKYKCEEEKDIDSVLRDELQFIEKLAEKLGQAEELRQYKALVRCQAKELTQLLEEREASRSLNQHLKALLTPDDPAKSQGQDLREQLAEGHRLAECFNKLSLESDEHDDEDITDAEVEKVQESPDHSYRPSDSNQPHGSTEVTFEGDEVDSAMIVDGGWSQNEDEEMPYFLPESDEHDDEDITDAEVEKVQESPDHSYRPSDSNQPHGSTEVTFEGDEVDSAMIVDGGWSQNEDEEMPYFLPESDEHDDEDITDAEVEKVQESPDHSYRPSDSNQPHGSTEVTFEGDEVDSAMIVDGGWSQNEDEEMPYFLPAPTQETRPQGTCSGDVSYYLSEMETSLTQPEPSTLVPNCLGLQLDQGFDCGNGLARQGPSSTTCSFTANADSGTQCSFQEMVAQPSGWLKSPPQREDDPSQHSADNTRGQRLIGNIPTSSVFKPKMIKRESRFSKWNPYPSHLGRRGTKYYQKAAKAEMMPIKQLFQLMRKN
ncbi:neuroblastoma breakpoint family member 4-like [Aotus nancymaae]|uniref:neuroblastoma breakpoint family member 4-like n=1 Tax=Aotus nancymaae TaxID=37293 RepID=UPI0030FED6EC